MIVVDTNIIIYLYVSSIETAKANLAFAQDPDWIVPSLWRSEFRNALVQYVNHQIIAIGGAIQIALSAEQLLGGSEYDVASDKVLRLATSSSCSAYDCEFVVLAQDLGVLLLTADKKVLRAFPNTAVSLDQLVNHE
jgi:predicted nucleic acid-binding protein